MAITDNEPIDYVVVGLGDTGRSAARFLARRGAAVVAMDTRDAPPEADALRAELPDAEIVLGGLDEAVLARARRVVLSPGVPPDLPAISRAAASGASVIGDVAVFREHADAPVIAITGTNGKSTVTRLVADMLAGSGRQVRAGANLGTPALDLIGGEPPDFYVLELSSFQLDLVRNLAPAVACVLNVTPDHLDRHGSFEAYLGAKARIVEGADAVVLNADDARVAALPGGKRRVHFSLGAPGPDRFGLLERDGAACLAGPDGVVCRVDELGIAGLHNVANALAAVAICAASGGLDATAVEALRAFRGLPHRSERIANVGGVEFVNDSKATNPGAARSAIEGLGRPGRVVLIAGGVTKGADFADLAGTIARQVHTVVLLGKDVRALESALGDGVATVHATSMESAVEAAARVASPGDCVLLSPACASFDLFASYEDRGDAFRVAVRDLAGR